jgi:TonB family protein
MSRAPLRLLGEDAPPDSWPARIPDTPPAPHQSRNSAISSVLLHVLFLAAIVLLPGRLPTPPPPEPESVVTIVPFEPIPDVRVPPAPAEPSGKRGGGGGARPTPPPAGVAHDLRPPGPDLEPASPSGAREEVPRPEPAAPEQAAPPTQVDSPAGTREPDDTPRGEETSRFDVGKALRDFRPAPAPKPSGPSTGAPRGGGGLGSIGGLNVPDLPPLPDSGFGFGNLQFESRDYDFTDYARQIYMAIWRAWHNRLYLTVDSFEKWGYQNQAGYLDHRSRIRFRIEASGQVTNVALERAAGCPPLDLSAMDALREVVLPPLPPDFPRGQETVHATFVATGDIASMRPSLRRLKAMNFF